MPALIFRDFSKYIVVLAIIFSLVISSHASAQDALSGLWQHAEKPAVLEFDLPAGLATIYEHKERQDATGLTIIKDISSYKHSAEQWTGHMYNGYIDAWVPVFLHLEEGARLVITDDEGNTVLTLIRLSERLSAHSSGAMKT